MYDAVINEIHFATLLLNWHALLGTGIACTFAGLIIWLAGLGMTRVATATVGGFAGCFVFYVFFSQTTQLLALGAFAGVVVGLLFEVVLSYVVGFATAGYNVILAILTAAAGAVLIPLGMIFLLSLKGAKPLSHVSSHQSLYLSIILAMIVFGTFEQLIFCRRKHKVALKKKGNEPVIEAKSTEKSSWRNR